MSEDKIRCRCGNYMLAIEHNSTTGLTHLICPEKHDTDNPDTHIDLFKQDKNRRLFLAHKDSEE